MPRHHHNDSQDDRTQQPTAPRYRKPQTQKPSSEPPADFVEHGGADLQLYGEEEIIQACLDMLDGKPGTYYIFNAKFVVEAHHSNMFHVVKFMGALSGSPLRVVEVGFYIPVVKLSWDILRMSPKLENEGIILTFLAGKEEMQKAKQSKRDTDNALEALSKTKALTELRQNVPVRTNAPPPLANFAELLTSTYGTFAHSSGAVLEVRFGRPHKITKSRDVVILVKEVPDENHPLHQMVEQRIFATQDAVKQYGRERKDCAYEGKALLGSLFRQWLRAEFRAVGVKLKPKNQANVQTADSGITSMQAVDQEHETAEHQVST